MDSNALQMMFSNGMQGLGAMQLGASNALSQQGDQAKLRAMQMENDQNAVMNPLNAQFKQGQIAQQQAELPGIVGQSQSHAAKGQLDLGSLSSAMEANIAKNSAVIGEAGMQRMNQDANKMGEVGAILKQFPPESHKDLLPQIMQKYGMDPNSPIIQKLLTAPDPSLIAPLLATMSDGMAKASQAYLANSGQQQQAQSFKKEELTQTLGSHERIAAANNVTAVQVANIQAESRKAAADAKAKAMASNMGIDKAIAHLEMLGNARTPEDDQTLENLKRQQLQARAAGANAVPAGVLGEKTPLQNAGEAAKNPPRPTGGSKVDINDMNPEQKAAFMKQAEAQFDLRHSATADQQTAKELQGQGMQYEPAKYEYKKIDGVWKRRPK